MFGACKPKILSSFLLFSFGLFSRPAFAQLDLAGQWGQRQHEDAPERIGGPEIGDFTAMPINDAARMRADAWDATKWEMLEHECEPHPSDYGPRGPGDLRMWSDLDSLTEGVRAWHSVLRWMLPVRTIYMDGRPHPSEYAPHTWQGFSTGEWEGDMLKVTTTHMKEGWVRRNGIPRSDKSTMIEYFIRHGDYFTLVTDVEDPVYMTEPFIRTSNWILDLGYRLGPNTCLPSAEVNHPKGWVSHHLPGKNPWLNEYASRWGIPEEAVRGGGYTTYPEYQERLAKLPAPPKLQPTEQKQ